MGSGNVFQFISIVFNVWIARWIFFIYTFNNRSQKIWTNTSGLPLNMLKYTNLHKKFHSCCNKSLMCCDSEHHSVSYFFLFARWARCLRIEFNDATHLRLIRTVKDERKRAYYSSNWRNISFPTGNSFATNQKVI